MKNLGAAAGQAAQAGVDHSLEDRADRPAGHAAANQSISTGGPGLQVQPRIGLVQNADQVQIPVVRHLMMQPADDVHFGGAAVDRFLPAGQDLLVAHQVALRVVQVGAKRAKHAAIDADVRGVQMRVDVVVGAIAVLALADQVGQLAHVVQRHVGPVQKQPVVERQPLAGLDLFADRSSVGSWLESCLLAVKNEGFDTFCPRISRAVAQRITVFAGNEIAR